MRFRFLHTYFHPSKDAVSQLLTDVAVHLTGVGHHVEAIATSGNYGGGGQRLPHRDRLGSIDIHRVWGPNLGKGSVLARLGDIGSYYLGSLARALTSEKVDRLVVLTSPPMYPAFAPWLKALRHEPYVHVVMDLYPDIAAQAGLLSSDSYLHEGLASLMRRGLRQAHRVIVLGTCMAERITRYGVDPERISIIQNWVDDGIRPIAPEDNPLRKQLGLEGKFIVEYSGNMGLAHRFDDLLEAAHRLKSRDDIVFLFIGGGMRRQEIEAFVSEHELGNVLTMDYFPREQLVHSLTLGDMHFVSLRNGYEGLIVPSKTYGVLAAGRPVLYQGDERGEIARMLREEGGGHVVAEGDSHATENTIMGWADNMEAPRALGQRAREVFEESYTRTIGVSRYQAALET